jgi:peptide/nickel transport system permease protein
MMDVSPPPLSGPSLLSRALPGATLRVGVVATLILLLIGFVSIVWTPFPIEKLDLQAQLQDPSATHLLGTDQLGRDLLSMTMKGVLTSFVVAAVATAIGLFIGVPLGIAAAVSGGWTERLILGGTSFLVTVSALVFAVLLTALSGPGAINAMLAIGIFNVAVLARVTHDLLLPFRGRDHIAASRLAGLGGWDLARLHVLPQFSGLLVAAALAQLAFGVLAEAGLSFVGLGSQPPGTSLGLMLKDAQGFMLFEPLLVVVPGVALLLIALSLNLIATALKDRFDA